MFVLLHGGFAYRTIAYQAQYFGSLRVYVHDPTLNDTDTDSAIVCELVVAHKSLRANTRFAPYKRFP